VRTRLAADLHDDIGASLSRIAILSEVVRRQVEAGQPEVAPALRTIAENARSVVDDMSDVVWFVDPRLDDLQHVVVRLRTIASELLDTGGISWTLEAPPEAAEVRLNPEQRRHLYLIVKESLTNILRHAGAAHAAVRIAISGGRLLVEVTDDGVGVPALSGETLARRGGHGLANLRARADEMGGAFAVGQGPGGRGTRVSIEVPLRSTA
jgi:signal transduction histidine kinase